MGVNADEFYNAVTCCYVFYRPRTTWPHYGLYMWRFTVDFRYICLMFYEWYFV